VGQSPELSLKAYLCGSGCSDTQLRQIGHNPEECVAAAKAAGIENHVRLSEADVAAIAAINPYYQSKDLQYSMSRPHPDSLIELAERLWESLHSYCIKHRDHHVGKSTAIFLPRESTAET
jgi:hypothetical protein